MLTFHEKFLPNIFIGNITLHSVYSVIVPPPAPKSFNTLNWRLNFYNWSQWVECWTLHKLVQLLKLMPPPSPSPAKLKTAPWLIKYFLSFHRSYFLYGICHPPNEFHSIARGLFWFNVNISLIWIKWYILAPSWMLAAAHISHFTPGLSPRPPERWNGSCSTGFRKISHCPEKAFSLLNELANIFTKKNLHF